MFYGCTSLKEIVIPDGVTEISHSAFRGAGLEKVTLGKNVESFEPWAFGECANLKSIDLPDGFKEIGSYSLADTALESIEFPDGLTKIYDYAFRKTKIESAIIPESVAIFTPQAVEEYGHINTTAIITIPCGCCASVSARYVDGTEDDPAVTPTPSILVRRNASISVTRIA